jgi:hypothetical protein
VPEFAVLGFSARQSIEPFVERVCLHQARPFDSLYRLGYRAVGTDTIVAAIEIPARLLEEEISYNLRWSCRLSPDGNVTPESSFQNDRASSTGTWAASLPLDQLIRSTLVPQNLHMEEATIEDLTTLLQILEDSANLVRDALAHRTEKAKPQLG